MNLSIIIPCLNEEKVLHETKNIFLELYYQLIDKNLISIESKIYFIDDGSKDNTWQLLQEFSTQNTQIISIKLSRNFGHQAAVLAGLFSANGDVVISIDADLQDDITIIEDMIKQFSLGNEIVYGVRKERQTDTFFKRSSAIIFYKFMKSMGVNLIYNHADFRLLSRKAIDELKKINEVNLFLRGIVPLLGFNTSTVFYDRKKRLAGKSKYSLKKMISFAWDGITSFSIIPLRLISTVGGIIFFGSLLVTIWAIITKILGKAIPGWTSTVLPIYFLGGIQILFIGIIGEYIGKIYKETKQRPRYIIEEIKYQ